MKKNFAALAVCSAIVFCGMGAFASDGFEVVPAYSSINEERYVEEVYYPVLGDSSFPISKTINDLVEKDNVATRSSVMASVEETDFDSGGITGVFAFNSFYQYNVCGDIVSVKLNNYTYQGGAHGLEYITSYTGNIGGKDIFGVQDLFRDSENGQAVLKSFIKAEIAKNKDGYFSNATETIEESDLNSRFYIDEQGNIVVYFNPYEIDAYAGGIKEFQISPDMLSGRLKTEVYSYLTNKSGQRCD